MAFSNDIVAQIRGVAGNWTAIQSIRADMLQLQNDAKTFSATFDVEALTGNSVLTLPDGNIDLSMLDSAELQFLSDLQDLGVTPAELDLLDGVTATTTEINYLDGVTSDLQTQLNLLSAGLMIEVANRAFIPTTFMGVGNRGSRGDLLLESSGDGWQYTNLDTTNNYYIFILLLPTNRGGLKLYVDAMYLDVGDADASNSIDETQVWGINGNTETNINQVLDNTTSPAERTETFTAHDCSGYDYVVVEVKTFQANAYALDFGAPRLRCYFGT